jgi:imidazole glycerol-phosphate synthase subunit HisH
MIAIIDYKAGNLTSVQLACEAIGVRAEVTATPARIISADRVIFPGVGAAGAAMQTLRELGLVDVIRTVVAQGRPFLGICLGTQIIFDRSEEDGGVNGVGLISGTVKRFQPSDPLDKVPQMGWNSVLLRQTHPIFEGIADGSEFYFVHSYYPAPADPACVLGQTTYAGATFASVVGRGNIVATQFHPEKSGRVGLRMLANFTKWQI